MPSKRKRTEPERRSPIRHESEGAGNRAGSEIGAPPFIGRFALSALLLISGLVSPSITLLAQELFLEKSDNTPMEVERIYARGLQYLTRSQNADGHWPDRSYGSEPAVVGLAILSMLAHGDDPNFGPYSAPIRNGLDFILKQMNPQTGYIGRSMYNHGFAALALAEAYGAVDDARLGPALEKSVSLILNAQNRNPFGAWRYSPESTDADTTVSGAQMVALFAARNAGIAVPEAAIKKGLAFFTSCKTSDGGYGYTPGTSANAARTAIGCVILVLAKDKNSNAFQSAADFLKNAPPESSYYHYYLYYASQAFFHISPEMWQNWNRRNVKTLASTQNPDGSWDGQFGPTFATSASLLSLALNYRYLPIYER
ncbi:MAG: terpene cyclase/mutase family protein [Verrucomicrobia bacterium]|nr:terpene cyclase/mutase family protein [Verrucomicrobiota bacterium]